MNKTPISLLLTFPFVTFGCATTSPAPSPQTPEVDRSTWHVSIDDEAALLAMEDARYIDDELVTMFASHPSAHYRERVALALARVGSIIFEDADGDGVLDEGEDPGGTSTLLEMLEGPSPAVVEAAAFALGQIDAKRASDALATLALSDDAHGAARAAAVEALSKLGAEAVDDRLWGRLTSENRPPGIRVTALRYAFRLGEAGLDAARAHLGDPTDEVREAAAYTHSRAPNPDARAELERLLRDRNAIVRSYAVRAISRLSEDTDLDQLRPLMFDPHPWVRTNAVRAVSGILDRNPELAGNASDLAAEMIRATRDPDPGTRAIAIEALGHFASVDPKVRARIDELLDSPEWWFRTQAALALARAGLLETDQLGHRGMKLAVARSGAELNGDLREALLRDEDASVRAAAISSIPDDEVGERSDWLVSMLEQSDVQVRGAALGRLATTGADAQTVEMVRALELRWRSDQENDARLAAISILVDHDLDGRESLLRDLLDDPDPVVRRRAADAIASELGMPRPQQIRLPTRFTPAEYRAIAEWAREPHTATIRTVRGNIDIALLTLEAPMTAWNFARLAADGYFDDTSFMRVVPNFVIQGGDPRRDMTGGPGYAIRDEINQQHYTRGAVGMALSGPDTGGSQFFITHSPQYHLDGGYTIFGRVIDGMNGAVDQMHLDDRVLGIDVDTVEKDMDEVAKSSRDPLTLQTGEMTREELLSGGDEYDERRAEYAPDPDVLSMLAMTAQPDDEVTVVLGTWCRDSQRYVPRYMAVVEQLERDYGVEIETRYIAVDRSKQHPADLIDGLGIQSVATFIVYRDGVEIGRIVETPRSPLIEDDLLAILAGTSLQ